MPTLKTNILNFGCGISYKYKGVFSYSFDRFYVVTKFILPTIEGMKISPITFIWNVVIYTLN